MAEYICVFDCETVPDSELLLKTFDKNLFNEAKNDDGYDEKMVSQIAMAEQERLSGSKFLPVCFHRVVTISAVLADKFGKFIKVSTIEGKDECEKISKFIGFIQKHNPRLISFNGRGFDLPMLMIRAMKYNICATSYFSTNDKENGKDKWTNYRSRYDGVFHMDLLDHISDFKAVSGLKLDYICSALNLPGKYDVHGDEVLNLFYQNQIEKINEYCESDTLNTYWLFLKYELLRGYLTLKDYLNYIDFMGEFLAKNKAEFGYTPVFCEFIKREIDNFVNQI